LSELEFAMSKVSESSEKTAAELENIYAISRLVNQEDDWRPALDKVVRLIRALFIVDNLVLYLPDAKTGTLEVSYARVVGRGKSSSGDISWGEAAANQVFGSGEIYLQQPDKEVEGDDRLHQPYLLGVPLRLHLKIIGAMVFIRFGGPRYDDENTRLAAFVAEEITHLVVRQELKNCSERLEAERKQTRLQEDFISTISHELLTPLGFIKGYTTTLLRPDTSWDEGNRREFLTIIDEETDRLQELIDNLLDSARLQSGSLRIQFQPVRLDGLLKDVSLRAKTHHRGLQVEMDLEPISPIEGDPRRLSQVFENILSNAVKYAPGSPVFIALTTEDGRVHLQFRDLGPGIPAKYISHLFERFFRNPEQAPNVRGSGLGLFICRQIIDAHHGEILAESDLGEGTTIHVFLPFKQTVALQDQS
jgi:signal transduction histidine kinase